MVTTNQINEILRRAIPTSELAQYYLKDLKHHMESAIMGARTEVPNQVLVTMHLLPMEKALKSLSDVLNEQIKVAKTANTSTTTTKPIEKST